MRSAVEDQAGRLRQELSQSLKGFQELTVAAFAGLRDGIDGQVRGFGERLDAGIKIIDERAAGIATKLNGDMEQMRSEANTSREALRGLIEAKLDHSTQQQGEAAKALRDELGGNFQRLGARVSESLGESSRTQKERLENVTSAVSGLSEKLEKGQESLRSAVESRLDAIRQENAAKLDEMRQTVDEKLQTTLETRLGKSFNRVVEHLERVHKGIGESGRNFAPRPQRLMRLGLAFWPYRPLLRSAKSIPSKTISWILHRSRKAASAAPHRALRADRCWYEQFRGAPFGLRALLVCSQRAGGFGGVWPLERLTGIGLSGSEPR